MAKIQVDGVVDLTASAPDTNFVFTNGGELLVSRGPSDPTQPFSQLLYHVNQLTLHGTAAAPASGAVFLAPYGIINFIMDHGVHLDHGTLSTSEHADSWTFDGNSQVANGSNLSVWAGRYFGDHTTLNGSINVAKGSSAEFYGPMFGDGTVKIDASSTVSTQATVVGLQFDVDGLLNINATAVSGPFLATIKEGATGTVDVYHGPGFANLSGVVETILHTKSGVLDLDGAGGVPLMSIQFADSNNALYTTADGHGGLDITTHQMVGSLPSVISHT